MKYDLEFLELMAINACNLACEGCTTFSDLRHQGYQTWAQAKQQLVPWLEKINIQGVGFMGGEPLMNPTIVDWIYGIRALMPETQIRFVTNGILLEKNWDVFTALDDVGNSVLKITKHIDHPAVTSAVQQVFNSTKWYPVKECGIDRWISPSGLRFQINSPTKFFKTFRGSYNNMQPHNNNPNDAFDLCVQKRCPMLYQGHLFKCGTLALTPDILKKHNDPNIDQWQDYITQGLSPNCSDIELLQFVNNFGKPHRLCRQCPSKNDVDSIVDHRSTVRFK
jgi:sulfatase maturation enzyme AslB (radical SAM superfamily)